MKTGRPLIHAGYSIRPPRELIRGRQWSRLRRYLADFRSGLLEAQGGEQITAARLALVDRSTMALGLIRQLEIYFAKAGPWTEPGKVRHVIEGPYLALTRELRANLLALGLDRQEAETIEVLPWDVKDEVEDAKETGGEGHNQSGE